MVFVKMLGIMDIFCAIVILIAHIFGVPWNLLALAAMYLIAKGIVFKSDFNSYIDIFSGVYAILLAFGIKFFLTYVIFVYLLQKGLRSLF